MANPSSPAIPAARSPENPIASLMSSFTAVPPAAVPAVIDCVLASSSIYPSLLFSSLLRLFPDPKEMSQKNHILSYATALCHLVKSTDAPMDALRDFVWKVFVPVMKAIDPNDYELLNQIEETLFDVVSMMRAWELMGETLVPYCLRSVGLSMGMVHSDDFAIYQWSTEDSLEMYGTLIVPIACRILTLMLQCVLTSGVGVPNVRQTLEGFAANLIWDLSNLAVGMLMRPTEDRSFNIRLLLPSLFKWLNLFVQLKFGAWFSISTFQAGSSFATDIWKCCISLFSFGDLERRDAFNILSLYFSSFYNQQLYKNVERDNISIDFDITTEKEFWEEIRRGMVDGDATLRKQALYILKLALDNHSSYSSISDGQSTASAKTDQIISCNGTSEHSNMTKKGKWAEKEAKSLGVGEVCYSGEHCLSSQDRWKVFVLLYEMLEEYGTHLVEAAWTHQVFLLVQSMPPTNSDLHVTCGAGQNQMETIEGIFSWLAVLWERGFFHDNPQVRCLIMESFLGINWEKDGNCATKVPRSFVLGPLLLGLNDAVHHKDFGVNGIYTSRTIQGATKYVFNFSCQMSSSERVDFIWSLASLTRQESFGRAGLMALAFCIVSAACHTDSHNMLEGYNMGKSPENQQIESAQDFSLPSRGADLLDVLGFVIESSKQHFNPNYRLQVCEQVIKAASSVINISSVPLGLLLHFLSTVPREFTDREGTLRVLVQQWLTRSNNVDKGFGSFATETCVLNGLVSFPLSFIRKKNSHDCSFAYDDEDVEAWILEAQRWARVLFLVIREAQHLDPIFMFFQKYCSSLCNQDGIMEWVPIKLLILILSLVEELQIEWTKCEIYNEAKVGREHNGTGKLHCSSLLLRYTDCVTIHGKFASLMIELVAFSKLVSPIFWSFSETMDTQLPQSLRGKLGGPSQRRLASSTTSSVLRAILSLRTVACVSSLCTRLRRDDHLDYSFSFLWDFCWKTIESRE
ncbi:uncharacterized protein M6B38_167710 [Iris pallida]|uniref:Uncharacterized protein n=1 Tax=Iris pallida TaxID=29817 RepID=A0AAX6EVK9_IRIPA|nr:uncharacterized protein M6B38_167710 [Iris pallida]